MLDGMTPSLITPSYRDMNAALHAEGNFGTAGETRVPMVRDLARTIDAKTILDYGSGTRQWLRGALGMVYRVASYDPCIPGLDDAPAPADLVVCTDVLGHVEPDCLDAVLDDLQRCTGKVALLIVETSPAKKTLPDGRNAHLIQQPVEWWLPKLTARWQWKNLEVVKHGFLAILTRKAA